MVNSHEANKLRVYEDELTHEKATTTWRSAPERYRASFLLEVTPEVHAKVQEKFGVEDWNVNTEALIRHAFKKAFDIEFSARAFDRTLPEVVAASEARRAHKAALKEEAKRLASASDAEWAIAKAWRAGKTLRSEEFPTGKTDQQIYDELVKSGVDKTLLTKYFPSIK